MPHQHIDGVAVHAVFSKAKDKTYRYRLEIAVHKTRKRRHTACVIMQNPSTADEELADKSVQFLEKLAFEKNTTELASVYRLIIVNQFARVQTTGFCGHKDDIGPKNDSHIQRAISESDIVLIAWGKTNRFKKRQSHIKEMLQNLPKKIRIYSTASHPSRASYDNLLSPVAN